MRQMIAHGGFIDAVTPTELATALARGQDRQDDVSWRIFKGAVILDATGAGTTAEKTPRMYDVILERITITGAVNGLIGIYENQVNGADLREIISLGTAGMYSDSFSNRIYIPAGSSIVLSCSGGPVNGQFTYNMQAKLIKQSAGIP